MSTGAYTTSDPAASMQVSCRISILLWFAFIACGVGKEPKKIKWQKWATLIGIITGNCHSGLNPRHVRASGRWAQCGWVNQGVENCYETMTFELPLLSPQKGHKCPNKFDFLIISNRLKQGQSLGSASQLSLWILPDSNLPPPQFTFYPYTTN